MKRIETMSEVHEGEGGKRERERERGGGELKKAR